MGSVDNPNNVMNENIKELPIERKRKIIVDIHFLRNLKYLISKAIPSIICKETACLAVLSVLLVIRTYLSIYLSEINGELVKSIVNRNLQGFFKSV